ncbi:unnamed protein product [Rhizoctonia solani]|uniref:Protein kinase domain-containing protein n=1 Tax=Rhizoctonia solani TaxID=456999 RepID=A0A8H3DK08_9AGAM|nr:unnamed protein product [Rhizoctonia solani]
MEYRHTRVLHVTSSANHTSITYQLPLTEFWVFMCMLFDFKFLKGSRPLGDPPGPGHGPTVYEGHNNGVRSVAISPDGNSIVSGSEDKTIRIWDAHRPSQIGKPLKGHSDFLTSVSCSPLGNMIASGSDDHTIRLWDVNTGRQIGETLVGHDNYVNSVTFSPGGNLIASASEDETVRLWDVHRRTTSAFTFNGHSTVVLSVAFSPDSTRIVSGSWKNICVWDIERRITVAEPFQGHQSGIRAISFPANGSVFVSGSDDRTLRLWDLRCAGPIAPPYQGHTDTVASVSFAPNGNYIASGSWDQTVRIWDVRAGRQIGNPLEKHTSGVNSVAFSPCGGYIASGSSDQTILLWNALGGDSDEGDNHTPIRDETHSFEIRSPDQIDQHMVNAKLDTSALMSTARGGCSDIWRVELEGGTTVAVKLWRTNMIEQCDYKVLKRTTREIYNWSKMKHQNIHPLMGIIMFKGQCLGMVSEWMDNGNLHEYIRRRPGVDRYQLCVQVAFGLAYMHKHNMVHGDLKSFNVLVSSQGDARLTDFGLSAMSVASVAFSPTGNHFGSIRWEGPELLLPGATKTKKSDVYALAMTILEIFTGYIPYPLCQSDPQVMNQLTNGILPTRPTDGQLGNEMWELLMSCWNRDPDARPHVQQVLESLLVLCLFRES